MSHSHSSQFLVVLLQFLPKAISYKQSLLLLSFCLLSLRNSQFIFCSILHYSLYVTLPFLCCHPVFLLSGSHFPSCSCSSPTRDRTVLCDVRIGRIGTDYFCCKAQDKTKTHTMHISECWACWLGLHWAEAQSLTNCSAKLLRHCFPHFQHNEMKSVSCWEWTLCLQTHFKRYTLIVVASLTSKELWLDTLLDLSHLNKRIQCYHCKKITYNCIQKYAINISKSLQPLTNTWNVSNNVSRPGSSCTVRLIELNRPTAHNEPCNVFHVVKPMFH